MKKSKIKKQDRLIRKTKHELLSKLFILCDSTQDPPLSEVVFDDDALNSWLKEIRKTGTFVPVNPECVVDGPFLKFQKAAEPEQPKPDLELTQEAEPVDPAPKPVYHRDHYINLGHAGRLVSNANHRPDDVECLENARMYIDREIERRQSLVFGREAALTTSETKLNRCDRSMNSSILAVYNTLNRINWALITNNRAAGCNTPEVLVPVALAMFKLLVIDIAHDDEEWHMFLRGALEDAIECCESDDVTNYPSLKQLLEFLNERSKKDNRSHTNPGQGTRPGLAW